MLPRRIRYGRLIVVDSKDASSNPDVGNEFQTAGNRTQYNRYSSAIDVDETSHFIAIIAGTFNTLEQVCRKTICSHDRASQSFNGVRSNVRCILVDFCYQQNPHIASPTVHLINFSSICLFPVSPVNS